MRFIVKNFGPIKHADVTLGNFTVFIGPGGTGKIVFGLSDQDAPKDGARLGNFSG